MVTTAENAAAHNSFLIKQVIKRVAKKGAQDAAKQGTKKTTRNAAKKQAQDNTKSFSKGDSTPTELPTAQKVEELANKVARDAGGSISPNKSGYTIKIPHGKSYIEVRIMEQGGMRTEPYYRVGIPSKQQLTREGLASSDKALTHIEVTKSTSAEEIINLVKQLQSS
jgi:hypothetical protein